jgi:hypothetical protein
MCNTMNSPGLGLAAVRALSSLFLPMLLPRCVNQLSVTLTNTCDNQLIKRKGLFWPTVLEVSVHD